MAGMPALCEVPLRAPDEVLRLDRLGSAHQTRISFLRVLLRRIERERWRFSRPRFDLDARGVGTAVYEVHTGVHTYSLVCFGHDLPPDKRTDRVIAEQWDATFVLFDGQPDAADLARLSVNVPRQEAGRFLDSELVLARANRSVRLFEQVIETLARGEQPDECVLDEVGYLMRTTAVYGNGKFGIADRARIQDRPEMAAPFQAEMLSVYLIRAFTVDLVEHIARLRAPRHAVPLAAALRRRLGVGNATGLGMAPFLVRHPVLLHRWVLARERALARVRSMAGATRQARAHFRDVIAASRRLVAHWKSDDAVQAPRIAALGDDLGRLAALVAHDEVFERVRPWDAIHRWAGQLSLEGQEYTVTLLLEPHGDLVDGFADELSADEPAHFDIDGARRCADLLADIERCYPWALRIEFEHSEHSALFWYVSQEKLEPRLGRRALEPGAEREQPLAVARDVKALYSALRDAGPGAPLGMFLLQQPCYRHAVRRVQTLARHPYAEIHDNLIGANLRPVDILRCKLAFFGVTRFDPKSDKWLRITLYQGAPHPHEIGERDWDGWIWPA